MDTAITRSASSSHLLELRNVSFDAEDKEILKDINLTLDDHFVAVTGPNGSGKSTLLKIIMGIFKPTSGQILFDGLDITDLTIDQRANLGISFAFQQPVRFKGLRVRDLLSLTGDKTKNRSEQFSQACAILSEVGLCAKDYIDRELNDTLSGGEMKRIEIAMTAARSTKLTLFDEPEAGIDLWSFQSLIRVFEKLSRATAGTILIISHQERILSIADKIIYLKDGRIDRYDDRDKVLSALDISMTSSTCQIMRDAVDSISGQEVR